MTQVYKKFKYIYSEGAKDFNNLLMKKMDFNLDEIKMEFDAQYHALIQNQASQFKEVLLEQYVNNKSNQNAAMITLFTYFDTVYLSRSRPECIKKLYE
eukprot:CAMPEP_0116872350 /NCGR_PEP_ID=MMETSP0463-20121206/3087_1 /TAXON_ID=181622 /ORGANISM="Strombidinopsis sp, Strain SopsisLIS2011" /LENGTH=97 /DNA_ID=CAMNT_0004512457 /DNA_START=1983 /DNA_END=2276 /DNA_ORIENTATION=+